MSLLTQIVLSDIEKERIRQDMLWGEQGNDLPTWFTILGEEVGEVATAIQSKISLKSVKESDGDDLYTELIHVAAVAVKMAEKVKKYGY